MNCKNVQTCLDHLLIDGLSEEINADVMEHLSQCKRCAHEYETAMRALASIRLSQTVQASPDLKKNIMNKIIETHVARYPEKKSFWRFGFGKPVLVAGIALVLLFVGSMYFWSASEKKNLLSVNLLTDVWAAEKEIFAKEGVIYLENEIIVNPVSDPVLSRVRWFPVISIEPNGKPRFHQLNLPAEQNEGYTVHDESWYDPETCRFMRLFSVDGVPVYAYSFDGSSVYLLEQNSDGNYRITGAPITGEFLPPQKPAGFLGIATGLPSGINEKDSGDVSDEGESTLRDGSIVRILKVGFPDESPVLAKSSYVLYKIRKDDTTIAEIEWITRKLTLLIIRRVQTETLDNPDVRWNLDGFDIAANTAPERPKAGMKSDMVIQDVSVNHMIEKADFETYIFDSTPSWANRRTITDLLDIVSPSHRMYTIIYSANDSRHVVLTQAYTFNEHFGLLRKGSTLKYTSPNGFKVWSGLQNKWMAKVLLSSAQSVLHDTPSDDRTGYILESPSGTFPCIAINGEVTDEELHALIDSLVPARKVTEK